MSISRRGVQELFLFVALVGVMTMDDQSFDADVAAISAARAHDVRVSEQQLAVTAGVACCSDDDLVADYELADRLEREL